VKRVKRVTATMKVQVLIVTSGGEYRTAVPE
jgi:hypothetical protein